MTINYSLIVPKFDLSHVVIIRSGVNDGLSPNHS